MPEYLHTLPDVGEPHRLGPEIIAFPDGTAVACYPNQTTAEHRASATDLLKRAARRFAVANLIEKEEAEKAARDPHHRLDRAIAGSTLCVCTLDGDACDAHEALAELGDELDRFRRAATDA